MPSEAVALTGNQNIDALLSGVRWSDTVLTYGMPTTAGEYGNYAWLLNHDNNPNTPPITVNETTGFSPLAADQQEAVIDAFSNIGGFVARSILRMEPGGGADMRYAMSSTREPGNTTAYGAYPSNDAHGGDGWFNPNDYNDPFVGTYDYQTFYHEIGHTLGLKHGHEADNGNNTVLTNDFDSQEFTVMTYRSFVGSGTGGYSVTDGHYPQSFMMLDILALQTMYGADYSGGDTTYRFDANTGEMFVSGFGQGVPQNSAGTNVNVLFRTIWDGAGIDTYDFSGYGADRQLVVNLAPGSWTDVDSDSNYQAADLNRNAPGTNMSRGQVFNAYLFNGDTRSLIENAIGGAGADWLKGNQANNHLRGNLGRDILEGFDGNDTLDPGADADGSESYGGDQTDYIYATGGADYIDGGNGIDLVDYSRSTSAVVIDTTIGKVLGGWASNDTILNIEYITGSNFNDSLRMGAGDNVIRAGEGADSIDGGAGFDYLYGQGGDDFIHGGANGDWVDGSSGFDVATFGSAVTINLATNSHGGEAAGDTFIGIEQFNGSSEADTFVANDGFGARFVGGDGVDTFWGGARDDWFQGGKGADYINGGGGFDMVSYADAPNAINVDMGFTDGNTDGKILAGEWGLDTLVGIEDVEGTAYADTMYGDERGNKFAGLGGDDFLQGDRADQPTSADILLGGTGNDTIWIGVNDFADGEANIDSAFFVGNGAISLDFIAGIYTVGGAGFFMQNFEIYNGTTFNDSVQGAGWGETISLGGGNDTLRGGGGDDFLYTSDGADVLDGGIGRDTIGFDRAMVADWQAGVLDASIAGDAWIDWDVIQGSSGNDRIRTNSWGFAVELRGGAGNDTLAAGVSGVVGDTLLGEDGNDALDGGAGNDTMGGGAGLDTVTGAAGVDLMTGGGDADMFDFNTVAEIGILLGARDVVTDFETAIDRLDLDDLDASTVLAGLQHFTFVGSAAHTGAAASLRFIQSGGNTIVYGDVNGDGNSDFGIQLNGLHALTAANFANLSIAVVQGTASAELLLGNGGAQRIAGLGGNDTIRGGLGGDTQTGGDGNDVFDFNSAAEIGNALNQRDVITDFLRSIDSLDLSDIDANSVLAGKQNFTWMGTAGHTGAGATLRYQQVNGNTLVYGDVDANGGADFTIEITGIRNLTATDFALGSIGTVRGTAAADTLAGAPGGMSMLGLGGDDTITGSTGADTVSGGAGADRMTGREGSDRFVWDSQAEFGNGAGGRDVITDFVRTVDLLDFAAIDANTTVAGLQHFTWLGTGAHTGAGATLRFQQVGSNTLIYGDTNANGTADFTLELTGLRNLTAADFTVASISLIQGTNGNDTLAGAPGGKIMQGLDGDDTITGGAGADTIWGGAGADRVAGGLGADQFKWGSANHMSNAAGARDIVSDFQQGIDRLDLSGVDANSNVAGNQAFTFLGTAAHTGAGATLRYQQVGALTYIYADLNGDKAADFTIALAGLHALVAADFVL